MTSVPLLVETSERKIFRYIYLKNKTSFRYFFCFFQIWIKFRTFWKKDDSHTICIFWNYRPRKRCLDKCLNAPVWEDPSTGDMVNGPKHWFNLNESVFIILSDNCEGNWVAKVTVRHMKILQTFSSHIDCWWQVFPY